MSVRLKRWTLPIVFGIGSRRNRRIGVVLELVGQTKHAPVQLDVLVSLVVTGAAAGRVGHLFVAAQAMLEEP